MTNKQFWGIYTINNLKFKSILALKQFEQIIGGYTSRVISPIFSLPVFHNEHLYVSYAAFTSTSRIWRTLRYKGLFSSFSSSTHSRLDACRHMYGHLLHLIPPIAVQYAGPSWQPLWGSPTLPWPTCTLTVGSGAGCYNHVASCSLQNTLKSSNKARK